MAGFQLLPDFKSPESLMEYFSSMLVHAGVFLAVLAVLTAFVFRPFLRILHLRRKKIDEVEAKASQLSGENRALEEEYQRRRDGASQLAVEKKEVTKLMGRRRAEMIITASKKESNRYLDEVLAKAGKAFEESLPAVRTDAEGISNDVVEKVIGK